MYSPMIDHLILISSPNHHHRSLPPCAPATPPLSTMTHSSSSASGGQDMGGSVAGGGSWLGFSLSPHVAAPAATAMDAAPACSHVDVVGGHNVQAQQQYHGGIYYPPAAVTSSSASLYYSNDSVAAAHGGYYSGISSMPLKSDGSLCIMEALRRSEQEHHGVVLSASPKLEDFLGTGPAMALSLDNSSYYYGGHGHGHGHQGGHGLDHGAGGGSMHHLQYALIPGAGDHDVYYDAHVHAHAPLVEEQSAAASMAAAGWMARGGSGYDTGNGEDGGCGAGSLMPGHGAPGHLHPLTLSMSSGSQSSCVTMQAPAPAPAYAGASTGGEYIAMDVAASKKRGGLTKQPVLHRKSIDTFGQRTSKYRGVTRHRWTGRYEAHLWDNTCKKEGQTRKGRQVYLGGYDMEEKAARAYDLAALKYWGPSTHINFPLEDYQEELVEMKNMTRQEFVAHLRRKSSGFSRGASIYRGVTRHHQHGRWQARIGRVSGNKDLYLGTFSAQEEAAEAYDVAAIKFRGLNAVTNFDITRYDVDKIMESSTLLPGELARRKKDNDGHAAPAAAIAESAAVADAAAALVLQAGRAADWKLAAARTATPCGDEHSHRDHHDLLSSEAFSALHDIVSVDAVTAGANGNASARMSNASSVATSLSNSWEQSPDRGGGLAMLFAKPAAAKLASPLPLGSWVSSSPVPTRPGVSVAHMPLFAAWTDA